MPNPLARTKSVGFKVTEDEYAAVEKLATEANLSVGEWCRGVVLAQLDSKPSQRFEEILLSEILGTRMLLLTTAYAIANGEHLTRTGMQAMIRKVDDEKLARARERLRQDEAQPSHVDEIPR